MPDQGQSLIGWIVGGMSTLGGSIFLWMNGRIDKRVTKDEFSRYEKNADERHEDMKGKIEKIEGTTDKIWNKLEGKQDKE